MTDSNTHPEPQVQKRRSTRIVQAVPLTVTGVDALGRPFQERTSTLIINCQGCRYQSKHYVLKNMWVTFEVPHNEAGREPRAVRARVTWIQRPRTVRELFQIGVELEVPGNVWGIAFPPGDWFPFPEAASRIEIPAAVEQPEIAAPVKDWTADRAHAVREFEPAEDNVRVLPLPGSTDTTLQVARQVSRLVMEAKQQLQSSVRETAAQAVAAETRPLLDALQGKMQDAAEKTVEAAVAAHMERMQRESSRLVEGERDASLTAMRAEWSQELDRRLAEARLQVESQLTEVERARRADFEQQIQNQLLIAIQKLQNMSGTLGTNAGEARTAIDQLRQSSEEAVASETQRWKELMDQRSLESQAHLAQLDQAAKSMGDQIAAATSAAESGWRGLLEADLAAASMRWNEKIETSIEGAARQAAERLARSSESSTQQIEQKLQQRISVIGNAFSQVTAEAESVLGTLRDSIGKETARTQDVISQLHQAFEQIEARKGDYSLLVQSASDELARRGEALIEIQSNEMNRHAESAIAGMAERLQPVLESAGHQTIERLANELDQRLAPQLTHAREILSNLALEKGQAEKALAEHRQQVWQASDRSVQESLARAKELLAQVESEFSESARNASAKWFAELENKATETTHNTFEALFKSADWYEKKAHTQMQSTLEKGVDQAATSLREKAGELSGLFASELDHYSRSYVEHAQSQMEEIGRDAAERTSLQMAQAGETASANFTDRAESLTREQFEILNKKSNTAFEQNAARIETHATQVRSKLENESRSLASEFQRGLSQQAQQTLAQGKQDLATQIDLAKDSLRIEAQSLDRQLQTSMMSLGTHTVEEYKQRLENASNTWMLTAVTKLNQQSQGLIDQLAATTEKRLRATCSSVFAEMGEILRQRLAGLSAPVASPASAAAPASDSKPPETKPQE